MNHRPVIVIVEDIDRNNITLAGFACERDTSSLYYLAALDRGLRLRRELEEARSAEVVESVCAKWHRRYGRAAGAEATRSGAGS